MRRCKLLLAFAIATVTLGVLTSSSGARSFSTTSQTMRTQFRELKFEGPFGTTTCQMTMEGSLHSRTIAKTAGSLVGYITSVRLGVCAQGTATVLTETLPWHMQYGSFSGTLPSISEIELQVIGASFRVRETFGVTCLATSTRERFWRKILRFLGGVIKREVARAILRTGAECFGAEGTLSSDEAPVTVQGSSTASITINLI
jgi:hypothetical protein